MPATPARRRRWRTTLLVLVALSAVAAALTWWLQQQASAVAADLIRRAVADAPALPDVPSWPLATAAAVLRDDATPFPFDPARPTLVVLLHGMSPSDEVDERVGSHTYARHYWGHAFVRALLESDTLVDAAGAAIDTDAWVADAPPGRDGADALVFAAGRRDRAALLVTRDASLSLGAQTHSAAVQISDGLARFDALTGVAGQLVLLGHSMGGLVGRHLLVNPPVAEGPFGLADDVRSTIDALRDRSLYLITLGTPHEGSQAADRAALLREVRRLALDELVRPNRAIRTWVVPLVEETSPYLRIDDAATEHLRSDVWAALNDARSGLLAPHRLRRSDGSLVPVYALASRSPGGRFFVDPLVSERIELELARWYAEQLSLDVDAYLEYTLQMLLADPTMYTLGVPERGWGDVAAHPAPAAVLDRVTRVVTAPRRVTFGGDAGPVTIELASRVDYLRGAVAGEVATRGRFERLWCLLVRCSDASPVVDVGSVDEVDLSDVATPTVALIRERLLGRDQAAGEAAQSPDGHVGDGQIDADGVVPVDSALGLLMGGDQWAYLAAGQTWHVGDETLPGSWYRPDLDDPEAELPWTYLHHIDQQYDPAVAAWLAREILAHAGPEPAAGAVSRWR